MASFPSSLLNSASMLSLRCFVAVVETQSFSSAARQLRLAASSVTKHIQLLERGMAAALVHRTTRRISVTEAGERFYDQCLAILELVDSAGTEAAAARAISGHLRITAPPSFAAAALGPNLHRFLAAHPGLSMDVLVTSATPDLIRDRIDVAITLQQEPRSKLAHVLLAASPQILCAAPGYIAARGMPRTPGELQGHACLSGRFSELAKGWVLQGGAGPRAWNTPFRLLSDNGELLRDACMEGAGIGIFYDFHVRADLAAGRLVRVLPDHPPVPKSIYAVVPHRQLVRPQTRAFVDFARAIANEVANPEAMVAG